MQRKRGDNCSSIPRQPVSAISADGEPLDQGPGRPRPKKHRIKHRPGLIRKQYENQLVGYLRGTAKEPVRPRQLTAGGVKHARYMAERRVPVRDRNPIFTARDSKRSSLIYTEPSHRQLVDSINDQIHEEAQRPFVPAFIIRRARDQDLEAP